MRLKILWTVLVALLATVICYNFAYATQSIAKQKLFGPTKAHDTLSIIAEHAIPPHSSLTLNQVMVAIYANNISAFGKGNMNVLLKNKWLKIPPTQAMRAIPQTQAFLIVKRHELAWQKKEDLPREYIDIHSPMVLKTTAEPLNVKVNNTPKENALEQEPPKELTLPYTPLLRPVASLNFVFISPEELQRVQKDKILPLVLKPAVIARQIQLLAQEPMSALQTFDMWTLLSSQFQGLAIRFDQIEKDQQQIKQQLGALKQNDTKQNQQIEALQKQLQNIATSSKSNAIGLFIKSQTASLMEFFQELDDIFPLWPWAIAIFATLLVFVMAMHRYLTRKRARMSALYPIEKESVSDQIMPVTPPVTEQSPQTEIRIRPKQGSLHEAIAEILTAPPIAEESMDESNEITETTESESDFAVEDEMSSLLDLARAYSDMGDHDNARALINRIISEGSEAQRKDAEQLIEQLQ